MSAVASQTTSLTIACSMVYSGADQRKHESSTSLAFVRGIHRGPVNSLHKWPVTRKMFPFDDVIMTKEKIPHAQDTRRYGRKMITYAINVYTTLAHDDVIKWKHFPYVLLALCEGNSPIISEFPSQRPVMRSFEVFFDLHQNKRLSKHLWRRWFETPSRSLWRHCNEQLCLPTDILLITP